MPSVSERLVYPFSSGWSCFSNFYCCPIVIDGITYNSVQQFVECKKCKHFKRENLIPRIMDCRSPVACTRITEEITVDQDWQENYLLNVLEKAINAKFSQHADLKENLLQTGDAIIAFATPFDKYLGTGIGAYSEDVKYPNKVTTHLKNVEFSFSISKN